MEIPKEIKDEIWNYCRVNNITNIDEFTIKLLKQGFTIEKFGMPVIVQEKQQEQPPIQNIEVDSKIEESLVEQTKLKEENQKLYDVINDLKNELNKEKNKKDLYGEK